MWARRPRGARQTDAVMSAGAADCPQDEVSPRGTRRAPLPSCSDSTNRDRVNCGRPVPGLSYKQTKSLIKTSDITMGRANLWISHNHCIIFT